MKFPYETRVVNDQGCRAIVYDDGSVDMQIALRFNHNKERWVAPRLSYHLNVREIPCRPPNRKEGFILHSCDNRWCVEPSHLRIGTQKENMADRDARNDDLWSPESRQKLSKAKKGVSPSAEHKESLSAALKGKPWSTKRRKAQEDRNQR